jgi:tRNA(Ile)-lysidine synthase
MASSRKSKPAEADRPDLAAAVAACLKSAVEPGDRVLLALSGGIDSVVLLDLLARIAPRVGFELRALHVNHRLSPFASEWARFCREACAARGVPCRVVKVDVARGNSTEAAARDARYAALRKSRAEVVVLAHNADDQAETVLLQLFRGAGVRGLAAMPLVRRQGPRRDEGARRDEGGGMRDDGRKATLVRPLLDVSRADIEAYARRRKLEWVEDESNASTVFLRNWVRHEIAPRIAQRVPGYRGTLVRAARHLGEAAQLLDELAALDAGDAAAGAPLPLARLRALSPARAKNLLRFAIGARGWRPPDADRLKEALRQALAARDDARVHVDLGDCEMRRRAGSLYLLPARAFAAEAAPVVWQGEPEIALHALGGVLAMRPAHGAGMSLALLETQPVTIRTRLGGERLRLAANRPTRTVKNLLQEAQMPAWERDRIPFIYAGDTLACIPGIAVDHRFHAGAGEPSVVASWELSPRLASRG